MSSFLDYNSTKTLHKLAEDPIDLTHKGILTPDRTKKMKASALNLTLFYGTERVDQKVLDALFSLATDAKAIEKMHQMQSGAMLNTIEGYESEDRSVLHTAMRDFFAEQNEDPIAKEASALAYQELEKLKGFLEGIKDKEFTDLIQIGIGGSDLGPRAIYLALKAFAIPGRKVHFISNVDPDDATSVLNEVDLKKTLVVVVSKSGTTLETLTNEAFIRKKLEELGISPEKHMLAVTGKDSPMDDPTRYLESFYIWDYIGGRYSVTSMVGAVMLGFALGMEKVLEFLRGASSMDKIALKEDPKENLPLLSALLGIWNHNFLGFPTCAVIPYSQAMLRFPAHLQQCDMESNGKQVDKFGHKVDFQTGPVIWGEVGTNGQHSFYQLLHQGTGTVPIEFIGFKDSQYQNDVEFKGTNSQEKLLSNLFAQSIGLAKGDQNENPNKNFPGNRPNRVLFTKVLDPYTMGAILSYYENKIAFQGFIWNINSFDQEGVQLGKVLANQIIDIFASSKSDKQDEKAFPLANTFLSHLKEVD